MMKRKNVAFLLAVLMLLSVLPVSVSAESAEAISLPAEAVQMPVSVPEEEQAYEVSLPETLEKSAEPMAFATENFNYINQGGVAYLTYASGCGEELTIPSEIDSLPVKGLSNFFCYDEVKTLILPDSVEVIAGSVSIHYLEHLSIGAGLKSLEQSQVHSGYLKSITVSEENENLASMDGILYNKACDTVLVFPSMWGNEYTIPDGVKNIDAILESGADVKINYPENSADFVTEDGVVYNADKTKIMTCDSAKTGKYVMPETVTEITPSAFVLCTGLEEVVVSPNVTEISYCAFASCTSLKSVALPAGLVSIDADAFSNNDALESITLPDGVTEIGTRAFFDCDKLATVNIPSALVTVGDKAFYGNEKQTADLLVIPASVTEIGKEAFSGTGYVAVDLGEGKPYVKYKAFANCAALVSVKIGDNFGYNQFGGGVFQNCAALTGIDFGTGVKSVGESMFANCTALKEVILPANITTVDSYAFSRCTNLDKVTVEGNIYDIRESAFAGCKLTDFTFSSGASVNTIGRYAFSEIAATSFTLPENVTTIGYAAFSGSEKLASLDIPESVISMCGKTMNGTAWFENQEDGEVYLEHVMLNYKGEMPANTHVEVKDGIRVIGDWAFEAQRNLSAVTLGKDVQYIGTNAFTASGVKNIYVDEENPYFSSKNGILYNKDGTQVIYAPVDAIEIASLPPRTTYQVGESFSVPELSLKLTRRDGSTENFWYSSWYYAGYLAVGEVDMFTPGQKTVSVTFGSCTAEFEITVEGEPLIQGDIDGVEGVSTDDAVHLLFYVMFPERYGVNQSVDFDKSGTVDTDDAVYLLFHVMFPERYPL